MFARSFKYPPVIVFATPNTDFDASDRKYLIRLRTMEDSIKVIRSAGGIPLVINEYSSVTDSLGDLTNLIQNYGQVADGVYIAGGNDIESSWEGKMPVETDDPPNRARDQLEIGLIRMAEELNLPILGVCRGMQIMAISHGGKLIRDIGKKFGADAALRHDATLTGDTNAKFKPWHTVRCEEGSVLNKIFGDEMLTTSTHHKAIDEQTAGYWKITARAKDGIIEGIEMITRQNTFGSLFTPFGVGRKTWQTWQVGVEFHPERQYDNEYAQELFNVFIERSASRAELRSKYLWYREKSRKILAKAPIWLKSALDREQKEFRWTAETIETGKRDFNTAY